MDENNLLQEYLDGGLDEHREAALFAALAHDTALRQEFNGSLAVRAAVQAEAAETVLPAAVTASVFGSLGYAVPGSAASVQGTAVAVQWWRRYAPYAVVSVVSSVLTGIVLFLLFSHPSAEQSTFASVHSGAVVDTARVGVPHILHSTKAAEQHARKTRKRVPVQSASALLHAVPVVSSVVSPVPIENENNIPPARDEIVVIQPVQLANSSVAHTTIVSPDIGRVHAIPTPSIPSSSFAATAFSQSRVGIAARSLLATSFPDVNIPTQTNSSFTNIALSAWYKLSDAHAFGVECGREAFGQEFRQRSNGLMATVRQNPTLWWYGASYRLSFPDVEWNAVYPYAQAVLGGTEVGPLGKMLIGVQFVPERNIALSIGVEGSVLAYPVEGVYYSTNKIGLTYGIRVQF